MLRIAVLAVALGLAAAPVVAQAPASYTLGEYVEARRPVIVKRKLSGAEKGEADRLVSEIRAAVKKSQRLPPATLERLAPLAASGDRNLMKAMVDGYEAATPVAPAPLDDVSEGWEPNIQIKSLWSAALWADGDHSKAVWKQIYMCANVSDPKIRLRCPFDVTVPGRAYSDEIPKQAVVTPYLMVKPKDEERKRFETWIASVKGGAVYNGAELAWAETWAARNGADSVKLLEEATRVGWSQRVSNAEAARVYKIDQRASYVAEWEKLQAGRVAAKARGATLSEADEKSWGSLSHWLGGKYLLPFASETVIFAKSVIESLCSEEPGTVCQRQTKMYQDRADAARLERDMAQAPLRPPGSSDVSVRTYDRSGNYLGTVTMPSWQTDIVGAH